MALFVVAASTIDCGAVSHRFLAGVCDRRGGVICLIGDISEIMTRLLSVCVSQADPRRRMRGAWPNR